MSQRALRLGTFRDIIPALSYVDGPTQDLKITTADSTLVRPMARLRLGIELHKEGVGISRPATRIYIPVLGLYLQRMRTNGIRLISSRQEAAEM